MLHEFNRLQTFKNEVKTWVTEEYWQIWRHDYINKVNVELKTSLPHKIQSCPSIKAAGIKLHEIKTSDEKH